MHGSVGAGPSTRRVTSLLETTATTAQDGLHSWHRPGFRSREAVSYVFVSGCCFSHSCNFVLLCADLAVISVGLPRALRASICRCTTVSSSLCSSIYLVTASTCASLRCKVAAISAGPPSFEVVQDVLDGDPCSRNTVFDNHWSCLVGTALHAASQEQYFNSPPSRSRHRMGLCRSAR